jgi:hypothetical protein
MVSAVLFRCAYFDIFSGSSSADSAVAAVLGTRIVAMSKDRRRGTENPEYIKAMRDIRKSNAAQPHEDRRTRRKRTRADKRKAAIKDDVQ